MDSSNNQSLEKDFAEWTEKNAKARERSENFATSSLPVKNLYTPLDVQESSYSDDVGFPGEYPYTRGVQPNMYRGRHWTMRQYAGFGTPAESNERFKYLLGEGQTGLSVAFDLPTQIGFDSDDSQAKGEVGKVGVAIDSLRDMEIMFDGIPLDQVSTSMTINAPAAVLLGMYAVVAEKQGVEIEKIQGTVQNDVLKEYVARGTYIYPPGPSLRLAADLVGWSAKTAPRFNSISISGYHIRDAGSSAVQEIAFTFANAIAYCEAFVERGIEPDSFGPRISWIFNTHNNFFEEVAKYRVLRRMWARIMKDQFGATNPRSWALRTHTQTGGSTLTAQQPINNITRAAYQAMAAVMGGVQSMALSCYDEALAIPTEEAQRIALRTQQVLAHETGITDTVDPLAGSYYVESLTDQLEEDALAYMRSIEDLGGAVSAIESGYMQKEIADSSFGYQRRIENGEQTIVGVNDFTVEEELSPSIFRVQPYVVQAQEESLRSVRDVRDGDAVNSALTRLREVAQGDGDLMEPIMDSIRAYATIGEICGVMKDVFGGYEASTAL